MEPAPLSMTYNPPDSYPADYHPCYQLIRVVIVPPEQYRITAYVQNFEFGIDDGVDRMPAPALSPLAKLTGWSVLNILTTTVLPTVVHGGPNTFKVPRMLFYEPFDFVVSLYQRSTLTESFHLTWSECVPCVLNPTYFPQPPQLNPYLWERNDDSGVVRCKKTADEVLNETYKMYTHRRGTLTWAPNKGIYLLLVIRKVTRLDNDGNDTGESLTFYQDRVWALEKCDIILDEAHAAPINIVF